MEYVWKSTSYALLKKFALGLWLKFFQRLGGERGRHQCTGD